MEHGPNDFGKGMGPLQLESMMFGLTVSTTLGHRPNCILQVPIEPLFSPRHEGGEQFQKARVHEHSNSGGLNRTEGACGLLVWSRF